MLWARRPDAGRRQVPLTSVPAVRIRGFGEGFGLLVSMPISALPGPAGADVGIRPAQAFQTDAVVPVHQS